MRTVRVPAPFGVSFGSKRLADVFTVLGDPTRVALVRDLAKVQEGSKGMFTNYGTSKATMSHHFRILEDAGIIDVKLEGRRHLISLRSDDIERRFPGLLNVVTDI